MQFRILGPLEVWEDGLELELGAGRQRALLALLLLHANEVVSADKLIDELWGERPPPSASKVMQGYVSQLRRVLPEATIDTRPTGYLLRTGATDAVEFERLLAVAHEQQPADAARTLRTALALWRGPPFADFEYRVVGTDRDRTTGAASASRPRSTGRSGTPICGGAGPSLGARSARRRAPAA